jgi:hypothetical protein
MSVADVMAKHRRLAAPRQDGGVLAVPNFSELPGLIASNIVARQAASVDIQGRDLLALSRQARRQLLADAVAFTKQYRDSTFHAPREGAIARSVMSTMGDTPVEVPILLAGHQPQLFHPGVWCKNFALSRLAQEQGAVAINLLIDSDAVRTTSSRVPGGSLQQPTLASVPFDAPPDAGIPYEECAVHDRDVLASFGRRAAETIAPLVPNPLVGDYWPLVVDRARVTGNLGLALAQSRHMLEEQWGAATLELPQSHCCRGEPFFYFVTHLLAHLPRLWEVYNSSLAEYRRAQRIRSASHPVPDLEADDEWLEAPLWVWTADNPRRRPLFVRSRGDNLVLSDRIKQWPLEVMPEGTAERAAAQLADYARDGLRLRTRALVTTMYARLLLSDLFIHGIGGSKYDELTDLLIERFFGLAPPEYATISATIRLPLPHPTVDAGSLGELDHRIRQLSHHPEVFLGRQQHRITNGNGDPWPLIERKQHWLSQPQLPETAAARHRELKSINESLWPWVQAEAAALQTQRDDLQQKLRSAAILNSREYDFCLYPAEMLRDFMCEQLSRQIALTRTSPG